MGGAEGRRNLLALSQMGVYRKGVHYMLGGALFGWRVLVCVGGGEGLNVDLSVKFWRIFVFVLILEKCVLCPSLCKRCPFGFSYDLIAYTY